MPKEIALSAGNLSLRLRPDMGGCITRFQDDGFNLLRPARSDLSHPLASSCFPLVPYANRIDGGRFVWAGDHHVLAPNLADHRHPLHGTGWVSPWSVESLAADEAVLAHRDAHDGWPWPFAATQVIRVTPDSLSISLSATNLAASPAPMGLGFHPYFPGSASASIAFEASGVWLIDDECLPTRLVAPHSLGAWGDEVPVRRAWLVDHCFAGWRRSALIHLGPGGPKLRLTASENLGWLHIFAPPEEDFFCLEPVSHRPDALNTPVPRDQGVITLGAWSDRYCEYALAALSVTSRSYVAEPQAAPKSLQRSDWYDISAKLNPTLEVR